MSKPCRDQDITISPTKGDVSVIFNGKTIAHSAAALDLREAKYPVVIYIQLADVDQIFLNPSDHSTHCPYKGDASYYSLQDGEKISKNAVWFYDTPCPLVARIKGHVAFWGSDIKYLSEGAADS